MEHPQSIGQRIKQVRGELSQKAFGVRIGLSQTAVTALETNQSEPRLGTFNSIIEAFGINPEWLRTGEGAMKGAATPAYQLPPPVPSRLEEPTPTKVAPTMSAHRDLDQLTPEEQAAYWKARYEKEARLRAQEREEHEHEEIVRLIGSAGGQSFIPASPEAADADDSLPYMVAETNPEYMEKVAEADRIRIAGFVIGRR